MSLLAAFQASLIRVAAHVIGPLRRIRYGDTSPFFSYQGRWMPYDEATQGPWQGGGLVGGHMMYADVVDPSTPLTQLNTAVFAFAGTPDEGIFLFGANETGGPLRVWIRALDYAAQPNWSLFTSFGDGALTWTFRSGATDPTAPPSYIVSYQDADGNSQPTQSAFDRLGAVMFALRGLPAGRYELAVEKEQNASSASDPINGKRTYFNGAELRTCV